MNRINTIAMFGVVMASLTDDQLQEVYEIAASRVIENVAQTLPDKHSAIDVSIPKQISTRKKRTRKVKEGK